LASLSCSFIIAFRPAHAAEKTADLPSCALKFGWLATDYWLTKDLQQQIERLLFYQNRSDARFEALKRDLAQIENGLKQFQKSYKILYATNSAEGLAKLAALLDQLELPEKEDSDKAQRLLGELGTQLNPQFEALPVKNAELSPAWNAEKRVGKDFKPQRIIFGSTGRPGDDKTLPLGFDFGSGLYGAYVPMADSNSLAISTGLSNRTDPVFSWMRANHSGHHYWAGIYNNQNTYVAPWFIKEHGEDSDLWMKLADGKVISGSGDWRQVNIWNPDIANYIQTYCEVQARTFKDDSFLVCYDYTAEPHPWAGQPDGQAQYTGYNQSAVEAFRTWLQKKFGTIAKLNKAWDTNYAAFNSIQPPPDKYLSLPPKATPLTYEFERFRCDSHAALWKRAYDGYRKYDKTKPVVANAGMFMSGWPVEALDVWQFQKTGVADWIDMHMNNFWPNLPEQIYLYSLCRLSGKVPVQFEYVWTFPRTGPFDDSNESDFAAICQGSVWRNLAWGKKALVFFDFYYDWPAYHNAFFDRDAGYSILRPSACVVPVTKRRGLRFNDILMNTEVARPPIIIMEPTASVLNSPPLHPNKSFSYHTGIAGKEVHELLFPKNYPFLYVPEQAVLDGYKLNQHKVIILPEAPYLPMGMTEKLLQWIKQGGTLISFGPPGIWDPYGKEDMQILKAAFGQNEIVDEDPGKWKWRWNMADSPNNSIQQTKDGQGKLKAATARCGKGCVLLSTGAFDTEELKKVFYNVVDGAIGQRPVSCAKDLFELVLREDKRGHKYLFALNPDTRDIREDEIIVAKKFHECVDLGIGSGIPLSITRQDSHTKFHLRLHPGEGTVISLGPP